MDNSLEDDVFLDPDSIAGLESSIQKSTGRLRTSIIKTQVSYRYKTVLIEWY